MAKITSFRDLLVWQKSMNLAERCYRISKRFRRDDQLVLGHEIRKSCVSVPSNIAEGSGRHHTAEYIHHLRFSNGSNNELQTQVEIGKREWRLSQRKMPQQSSRMPRRSVGCSTVWWALYRGRARLKTNNLRPVSLDRPSPCPPIPFPLPLPRLSIFAYGPSPDVRYSCPLDRRLNPVGKRVDVSRHEARPAKSLTFFCGNKERVVRS